MDAIGSIVAKELKISRRIQTWPEYPNVAAIHPKVCGYNDHDDNIICIVDLAQERFQMDNTSMLESYWWLSFKAYCTRCRVIFEEYLASNCHQREIENAITRNADICGVIFEFMWCPETTLCGDHHIAELFIEGFYETDSLIALRTPSTSGSASFGFMSFSAENPYASMSGGADAQSNGLKPNESDDDDQYRLELLLVDGSGHRLLKWFEIAMPSIVAPLSTSREREGAVYNVMMKHWECRLSADRRYLLIFPQKLGEIGDVELRNNELFWVQSLYGNTSSTDPAHRHIFAVNACDLRRQFECRCLKLIVSKELPARFRMLPLHRDCVLIWNFSVNGAVDDLFAVVGDDNVVPRKLRNRILGIENAQNFANYRFKDGNLKDLIRDVPKLCGLNGRVVFGGACFVSVLQDIDGVRVYEDTEKGDGPKLIDKAVNNAFYYSSWCPVQILPPKESGKWITDYVPWRGESVLARWPSMGCKSRYGIWRNDNDEFKAPKWECTQSMEYDDLPWNTAIMKCYHFGERIKTLLLAIHLANQ